MTRASTSLHPLVAAVGRDGRLPAWARMSEDRRAHVERVVDLMDGWGEELELADAERVRWRAAARLHDALRGAGEEELRFWSDRDGPTALLHGPACARRLEEEGVEDDELVAAVEFHTLGHPGMGRLGRHLYLADFLEPGRSFLPEVRERLRLLMPERALETLLSVVALRIAHRLEVRGPVAPETTAFWNRLLEESAGIGATGQAAAGEGAAEGGTAP